MLKSCEAGRHAPELRCPKCRKRISEAWCRKCRAEVEIGCGRCGESALRDADATAARTLEIGLELLKLEDTRRHPRSTTRNIPATEARREALALEAARDGELRVVRMIAALADAGSLDAAVQFAACCRHIESEPVFALALAAGICDTHPTPHALEAWREAIRRARRADAGAPLRGFSRSNSARLAQSFESLGISRVVAGAVLHEHALGGGREWSAARPLPAMLFREALAGAVVGLTRGKRA